MSMQGWPELRAGTAIAEVGNWQRFMNQQGLVDDSGASLIEDEHFGLKTEQATKRWQALLGIPESGVVAPYERRLAQSLGFIPFLQAAHCTILYPKVRDKINLIVIHTMEAPETPKTAENVAMWFGGKTAYEAPMASAHYCIDSENTIQCVRLTDVAWHAPGANNNGIGIEHAGYANQSPEQWEDEASQDILKRSVSLVAKLCHEYAIPIIRLTPRELAAGQSGLCGHFDATVAFSSGKGHTDPGPGFPWGKYLDQVIANS